MTETEFRPVFDGLTETFKKFDGSEYNFSAWMNALEGYEFVVVEKALVYFHRHLRDSYNNPPVIQDMINVCTRLMNESKIQSRYFVYVADDNGSVLNSNTGYYTYDQELWDDYQERVDAELDTWQIANGLDTLDDVINYWRNYKSKVIKLVGKVDSLPAPHQGEVDQMHKKRLEIEEKVKGESKKK